MNLMLHGIGSEKSVPVRVADALAADPGERFDVALYHPANRHLRKATWTAENPEGRWRVYSYDEQVARDKASLDIFWLKDDSLADSHKLPPPEVISQEIAAAEVRLDHTPADAADIDLVFRALWHRLSSVGIGGRIPVTTHLGKRLPTSASRTMGASARPAGCARRSPS
jgi:hypothetical protein